MSQTRLDRLRARGTVVVEATQQGYRVSWWPTGQKGNPFVGRGGKGPALDPIVAELEADTRPPSRDWDMARWARETHAQREAEDMQRSRLRGYDLDDRRRERRSRELAEWRRERAKQIARRERDRVRRVLAG